MQLARRGFLKTMAAAAAGAMAVFDPVRKVWASDGKPALAFHKDVFALVMKPLNIDPMFDVHLELNMAALEFARTVANVLDQASRNIHVLQGVELTHEPILTRAVAEPVGKTGISIRFVRQFDIEADTRTRRLFDLPWQTPGGLILPGPIETQEWGKVHFAADAVRSVKTFSGSPRIEQVREAARQYARDILYSRATMLAPIGADLRPGVAFSPDVIVGFATDPESGLSARAVRYYTSQNGMLNEPMVDFEMACGSLERDQPVATKRVRRSQVWVEGRGYVDATPLSDDDDEYTSESDTED